MGSGEDNRSKGNTQCVFMFLGLLGFFSDRCHGDRGYDLVRGSGRRLMHVFLF